jgi:hypothetical protein
MSGHECPVCRNRFETADDLGRHNGRGCPDGAPPVALSEIRDGDTIRWWPTSEPVKVKSIWPRGTNGVEVTFEDGTTAEAGRGWPVIKEEWADWT